MTVDILVGDCRERLAELPAESVQAAITSPPYWGLRDYQHKDQLGQEETPAAYVEALTDILDVHCGRVLRNDGSLWLNLGDSYFSTTKGTGGSDPATSPKQSWKGKANAQAHDPIRLNAGDLPIKAKDMVGIPWRVAFAMQDRGWWLRSAIIWHKTNPMPESVTDRPTNDYEFIFLLTKSARYYYDVWGERMPPKSYKRVGGAAPYTADGATNNGIGSGSFHQMAEHGAQMRAVWTIPTVPFPGSHFAVFPPELPARIIRLATPTAGSCADCGRPWGRVVKKTGILQEYHGVNRVAEAARGRHGQSSVFNTAARPGRELVGWRPSCECNAGVPVPAVVLDPFAGAGTTGLAADRLGRSAVLIELNPDYANMARERIDNDAGVFSAAAVHADPVPEQIGLWGKRE